jgi:anti-sigma factor RsiW
VTTSIEQLSCQELVELVTEYVEGELPPDDRLRFEQHLETCDGCRQYLGQMRTTIELAGELKPADLMPEAEQALLAAFRDWKTG